MLISQAPPARETINLDGQPPGSLEYITGMLKKETEVLQLSAATTPSVREQLVLLKEYNRPYGLEERLRWSSRQGFDLIS